MQPGILITNNHVGNHSAESWAMATAEQLVPLSIFKQEEAMAARKLQLAVGEALVKHHDDVQTYHKDNLANIGNDYVWHSYDPSEHADTALQSVVAAAKGTPWEKHYADPTVQEEVLNVLSHHFSTSHHIELSAHSDKNTDNQDCQLWKAQHHPGQDIVEADGETFTVSKAFDNQKVASARQAEVIASPALLLTTNNQASKPVQNSEQV